MMMCFFGWCALALATDNYSKYFGALAHFVLWMLIFVSCIFAVGVGDD